MSPKSAARLAVAAFALPLVLGCGKKEDPAVATAASAKPMTPREMYEQRLKDPNVPQADKEQIQKALQSMPPGQ